MFEYDWFICFKQLIISIGNFSNSEITIIESNSSVLYMFVTLTMSDIIYPTFVLIGITNIEQK